MPLIRLIFLTLIAASILPDRSLASDLKTIYSNPQKVNRSLERSIYVMPEHLGWKLVEQCTRTVYYPDSFWRVTFEQLDALEQMLEKHLNELKQVESASFVPESLANYKRQYIGFEMNGHSYYYGNFFPRDFDLEVDPLREPVVICRGDQRFWGMLFNIDTFKFEAIERNDKLVKMKGPVDPFYRSNTILNSEKNVPDQ